MTYYHWSCDHALAGIGSPLGIVRPAFQPALRRPMGNIMLDTVLAWFTDVGPDEITATTLHDLGLQSEALLTCNRMQHCWQVFAADAGAVIPWRKWVQRQPPHPDFLRVVSGLEFGRAPARWFVSPVAVRVERVL